MDGKLGIHHAKLNDNAYAQGYFVGGENFLAFDGQIPLAHINQHNFNERFLSTEDAIAPGHFVTSGFQHLAEYAILVPQSAVSILDNNFDLFHRFPFSEFKPRSGVDMEHDQEQIRIR